MMNNLNRIEDIDLYIVGAGICSAVGGISQCIVLLIFCAMCWFGKHFLKGIEDEK